MFGAHSELVKSGEIITAESIKDKFHGGLKTPNSCYESSQTITSAWMRWWEQSMHQVDSNRYKVLESHTLAFLKAKFGSSDLDIKKVDFAFVSDYEFCLHSVRKMVIILWLDI